MSTHALWVLLGFLSPATPHGVGGKKLLDSDFGTLSLVFPLDSSFLLSAEIPLLQPLLLSSARSFSILSLLL